MISAAISASIRCAGSLVSQAGGGRLTVLLYHRVLPEHDPLRKYECDKQAFDWQMRVVSEFFSVLSLSDALRLLARGELPARAACVTFDDGYADNIQVALPILQRYGLVATFFVATGFLDGGRMWNDSVIEAVRMAKGSQLDLTDIGLPIYAIGDVPGRWSAIVDLRNRLRYLPEKKRDVSTAQLIEQVGIPLPDNLMMSSDHVKDLVNAGMEIGGHTITHPILANLDLAAARAEIRGGKEHLESISGDPVTLFAYPNGKPGRDYNDTHVGLLRDCSFAGAVSTARGAARTGCDLYQIPRFTPWDKTPTKFAMRLIHNYTRTKPTLC